MDAPDVAFDSSDGSAQPGFVSLLDDVSLSYFAGALGQPDSSSRPGESVAFSHDALAAQLAAGWLIEAGGLEAIQQASRLPSWVDPLLLAAEHSVSEALRILEFLLDNDGTYALDVAAQVAGNVALPDDDLLRRVISAAVGYNPQVGELSAPHRSSESFAANVWALAPRHGKIVASLLPPQVLAEGIEIIGQFCPSVACERLGPFLNDPERTHDFRDAIFALAKVGSASDDAAEMVLPLLRRARAHDSWAVALALRRLAPTPRTFAAIREFLPSEGIDIAILCASTLGHVGAQFPDDVDRALVDAVSLSLPDSWSNVESGVGGLGGSGLIAQTLTAIRETFLGPVVPPTAAAILVRHGDELKDLVTARHIIPMPELGNDPGAFSKWFEQQRVDRVERPVWPDASGRIPRELLADCTSAASWWSMMTLPIEESVSNAVMAFPPAYLSDAVRWPILLERGLDRDAARDLMCEAVRVRLLDAGIPSSHWRCWLLQVLREATTQWGEVLGAEVKVDGYIGDVTRPRVPDPLAFAALLETRLPEYVDVYAERVEVGRILFAARGADSDSPSYLAFEAAKKIAERCPWAGLDLLIELAEIDSRAHEWSSPLGTALTRLAQDGPADWLLNDLAPVLERLVVRGNAAIRREAGFAALDFAERLPVEGLRLLEARARVEGKSSRDWLRWAQLRLLRRFGKALHGHGFLDRVQEARPAIDRLLVDEYFWGRAQEFWLRLIILAMRAVQHMWKPRVRDLPRSLRYPLFYAIVLPQLVVIVTPLIVVGLAWGLTWLVGLVLLGVVALPAAAFKRAFAAVKTIYAPRRKR